MSAPRPSRRAVLGGALALGVGGLGGLGATGCSPAPDAPVVDHLVLAGGERGGTLVRLVRLLSAQLVEQGVTGTASTTLTAGSQENLDLVAAGEADLGLCHADVAATRDLGVVAVARAYQTTLHCLVRATGPVRRPEQLLGRRVAIGPELSGTADTARRLLEVVDPGGDGVETVHATPANAAISLAGGTIDAMFWWGGLPAAEILSVDGVEALRPLDLSALLASANARADEVYEDVRIPGSAYGTADVRTLGVACHLLCRPDLDGDVVRALVDLVADSGRAITPQPAAGLRYFTPGTLFDTTPVPLHPAAAARYRERHG